MLHYGLLCEFYTSLSESDLVNDWEKIWKQFTEPVSNNSSLMWNILERKTIYRTCKQ